MIPESWLKERLQTTDVNELFKRELLNLGLSDSDRHELLSKGPSPTWLDKWRQFIPQMLPGYELWSFESPPETWANLAGAAGYAIVRSGRIIASLSSRRS
jgi:hypothetical protein